jgi:integrase
VPGGGESARSGIACCGVLHTAWRLSLYGLRRGEVLGLRWSDIDLKGKTLTVRQARVLVEYRVRIEESPSRAMASGHCRPMMR